jgi:hypothetical protein
MTQDWPGLAAKLERLLKLRSVPFAVKLFERRAEMEAIDKIHQSHRRHECSGEERVSPSIPAMWRAAGCARRHGSELFRKDVSTR